MSTAKIDANVVYKQANKAILKFMFAVFGECRDTVYKPMWIERLVGVKEQHTLGVDKIASTLKYYYYNINPTYEVIPRLVELSALAQKSMKDGDNTIDIEAKDAYILNSSECSNILKYYVRIR